MQERIRMVIPIGQRLLMLLVLAYLPGAHSASQSPQDPNGSQSTKADAYAGEKLPSEPELRIGEGDLLEINVYSIYGAPDISQKIRVGNTGDISLPMLGRIPVAGLTAEEAQTYMEQKFKDGQYLKSPNVSVFVAEYATQGISVLGEVGKPGVYPFVRNRTVLDIVSVAGGLTPNAGDVATITRRRPPHEQVSVALSAEDNPQQNVPIFPGDTVVVDRTGIVYVVGDVGRPGGFPVNKRTGLTVLQAIALAEGTKPNASLNESIVIRKTQVDLSEIQIPLKKILSGKSPDLPLRADDIVFVPSSAAKGAARRSLEAIVQTATGVAIYRRY